MDVIPSSGLIKMDMVRSVLGKSGKIQLGDKEVRELAERPSGIIKMSDLRGKGKREMVFNIELITFAREFFVDVNANSPDLAAKYENFRKGLPKDVYVLLIETGTKKDRLSIATVNGKLPVDPVYIMDERGNWVRCINPVYNAGETQETFNFNKGNRIAVYEVDRINPRIFEGKRGDFISLIQPSQSKIKCFGFRQY